MDAEEQISVYGKANPTSRDYFPLIKSKRPEALLRLFVMRSASMKGEIFSCNVHPLDYRSLLLSDV